LPGPTDDYFAFKRWFEPAHAALKLPPDCTESEGGPRLIYSNQYTWVLEWLLVFRNPDSYIRIREQFAKRSRLALSRRIQFAYHYGPIHKSDEKGMPIRQSDDPLFVRIDNVGLAVHLHPENDPKAHIPQEKIKGLVLEDVDTFDFVKAAFRHRQNGMPIERELGYRIR